MPISDKLLRMAEDWTARASGSNISDYIPLTPTLLTASQGRDVGVGEELYAQFTITETYSHAAAIPTNLIDFRIYALAANDLAGQRALLADALVASTGGISYLLATAGTSGSYDRAVFHTRINTAAVSRTGGIVPLFLVAEVFTDRVYTTGKVTIDIVKQIGTHKRLYQASFGDDAHVRNLA